MHPVANQLLQLQELTLVHEEQKVAGARGHLAQLDEAIATMRSELPNAVGMMFGKLAAKDHNVIVPVVDNLCAACRMQLPISLVQQVRLAKDVHACPNCARFLYTPVAAARNTRRRPGRFEVQKPGIARFSAESLMIPQLAGKDCESVIREMAEHLQQEEFVDNAEALADSALDREALFSTAVDHGLAFPHVRAVEGGALTLAVGMQPKRGIHFDGNPKGKLSRLFFFMVIPTAASSFYLKLLAGLTETFMVETARQTLLECEDATCMWKTLIKLTRKAIK